MVQVPTAEQIARSSTRSGRIAPSGPSVSVGAGMADAGRGLQQAAYNLADLAAQERVDGLNKRSNDVSTNLTRFLADEEQRFLAARENSSESGIGFTRKFMEEHQARANAFAKQNFQGLSPDAQTGYVNTLLTRGNALYSKANGFENTIKGAYYDRTTNEGLDTYRTQIRNNAADFETLKKQGIDQIRSADMPEPWKAERIAAWEADASESKWRWEFEKNPAKALGELKPTGTKSLIRKEEGFRSEPYWDVNAWRIGYGSDTITLPDGSHHPVRPGMKITREDAERDLEYRLSEREGAKAREQVGEAWGGLSTGAQAALESVAYNYGSLPSSVVTAAKSGNAEALAQAVESLPANRDRRKREAAIIRGEASLDLEDNYSEIPFDRRQQLYEQGQAQYRKQQAEDAAAMRSSIGISEANAPVAISNTGTYQGFMPTLENYLAAYGEQDGAQKFAAFAAGVEAAKVANQFQSMSVSDIVAAVDAAKPTSSGNLAAAEQDRYNVISKAAKDTIAARESDPSGYTMQAFPSVAQAWQDAQGTGDYAPALSLTSSMQGQLGIRDKRLLPKAIAGEAVAAFKDAAKPEGERWAGVSSLLFSTSDPEQRRAIFDQLVDAGLPAMTEGAFEAMARGDSGAARRLMQAAMIDVGSLPGKSPESQSNIDAEIQSELMDTGQIGDIYYGLSNGSAENYVRAENDAKLISNAVHLRLRQGESLTDAVNAAAKDLYGDVKVVKDGWGVNVQALVPNDVNAGQFRGGLEAMLPQVREALTVIPGVPGDVPVADGSRAVIDAATANYADNVMAEGFFRNSGDGYVFIDPYVGAAVTGPDGQPLTFTLDEVMSAGQAQSVTQPDRQNMPDAGRPEDRGIGFLPPQIMQDQQTASQPHNIIEDFDRLQAEALTLQPGDSRIESLYDQMSAIMVKADELTGKVPITSPEFKAHYAAHQKAMKK